MAAYRIAILMTSFNRRAITLRALAQLFAQRGAEKFELHVFLVDDGSTDGTADAVNAEFPAVHVLRGDVTLFWNRGMRMAFAAALDEGFEAYLLLNDDTMLAEDALRRLVEESDARQAAGKPAIVVGSTRSPKTGQLSYGGMRVRRHGLTVEFVKVQPAEHESLKCDTMNGNIVLIPGEVARAVGNLEGRFHHHFGDLDYGLRARQTGFDVVVVPGYLGECGNNPVQGTWRDATLPFKKRWKSLLSPKGQPVAEWVLFTQRHYGWRWLHYACSPYVKTLLTSLRPSARRGSTTKMGVRVADARD